MQYNNIYSLGGTVRFLGVVISIMALAASASVRAADAPGAREAISVGSAKADPVFAIPVNTTYRMDKGFAVQLNRPAKVVKEVGGKFLVGGDFTMVNGVAKNRIARLNQDGSLDPTFAAGSGFNAAVFALAVQADGRIIVAGSFSTFNGVPCRPIIRLGKDGTLDPSFSLSLDLKCGAQTMVLPPDYLFDIAMQPDGHIIVAGSCGYLYNGVYRTGLARINADGTLDPLYIEYGFNTGPNVLVVQGDGRVVVGGRFLNLGSQTCMGVARFNASGGRDASFHCSSFRTDPKYNDLINTVALQPDGRYIVGGHFFSRDSVGLNTTRITRLLADGVFDASFNPGKSFDSDVKKVLVQPDGHIISIGNFTSFDGVACGNVARLNADGTLDRTFALLDLTTSGAEISSVSLTTKGCLLMTGANASRDGVQQVGMALFRCDVAPVFTTQPKSATVKVGGRVTFTAEASGSPAPSYQWFKDGKLLKGQTKATLTLANVRASAEGEYTVSALNTAGTAISATVTLTVTSSRRRHHH